MKYMRKSLAILLVLTMVLSMFSMTVLADDTLTAPVALEDVSVVETAEAAVPAEEKIISEVEETAEEILAEESVTLDYGIVHLDCGRKYFSVDSIKSIIDASAEAGFNYVQLAFGNDGLRFLLDDMSLTVNGTAYASDAVKAAIHTGNEAYYNFDTDELTETEMDTIIAYAREKDIGIIPLVNAPGHMDAILDAGEALTGKSLSYNGSGRTIDVTNTTAVAFTKAVVQKYIDYFASKGCTIFNMGADEYANDIYTTGGMGFGQLQSAGQYGSFVTFVNEVAAMIKAAGMIPMAFNDGIYYNSNTSNAFDDDIVIQYWSSGWTGYTVASASFLEGKGHQLVNAHGDYYWVLGKSDWQCSTTKAAAFNYQSFQGGTIDSPAGVAFLIWCDYPGDATDTSVVSTVTPVIAAFNKPTIAAAQWNDETVTPDPDVTETVTKTDEGTGVSVSAPGLTALTVTDVTKTAEFEQENYTLLAAYDITPEGIESGTVTISTDLEAGKKVTVFDDAFKVVDTCTVAEDSSVTFDAPHFSVYYLGEQVDENDVVEVTVSVGDTTDIYNDDSGYYTTFTNSNTSIADVNLGGSAGQAESNTLEKASSITSGNSYYIAYVDGDTTHYLTLKNGSLTDTTDIAEATQWTITFTNNSRYRISSGGTYLRYNNNSLTTTTSQQQATTWRYNSNSGIYYQSDNSGPGGGNNQTYYYLRFNTDTNQWERSTTNSNNGAPYTGTVIEAVAAHTTVTFTGLFPGTTDVVVGNTTYRVTVTAANEIIDVSLNLGTEKTHQMVTAANGTSVTYAYDDNDYFTVDEATGVITATAVTESAITVVATVTKGGTTIGTYTYSVTVMDQAPSNAMTSNSLTIDYWITNSTVYESQSTNADSSATITSTAANTSEGVAVSTLVPETAYTNFDGWIEVKYWQSMRLDSENHQTNSGGDDETADGTTFTHVRYYNSAWQYKTADGVWHYFLSGDQAVAYYMRHTEITQEVTTAMKDWGFTLDSDNDTTPSGENGQVALTVAVVYEDGTVSPAEGDMLLNSTTIFNYWENRNIGIIAPIANEDFTIERITYTRSESTTNKGDTTWSGDSTITWEKEEVADGEYWYDETEVWNSSMGTNPVVNGTADEIYFEGKNTAVLVLIYVKAVPKEDNLTVKYYDDTNNREIGSFQIAVNENVTFRNNLKDADATIPADTTRFDLGTDAYITNAKGVNQVINTNLVVSTLNIDDIYKSGLYQYTNAHLDDDKTLVIHYTLKAGVITDPTYVVDFGLKLTFPVDEVVVPPEEYVGTENYIKSVEIKTNGVHGTAVYDEAAETFTYTPSSVLTGLDLISVKFTFIDDASNFAQVGFMPATTVYYEEGFADYGATWNVTGTGSWGGTTDTTAYSNISQTAVKYTKIDDKLVVETPSAESNYGYAAAYDGGNKTQATSGATGDTLKFSFTGTGVDVFANCTSTTGKVGVKITNSAGEMVKMYIVDTAVNGDYAVSGTAYNTPIVSVSELEHGSYTATLYIAEGTFNFDGFRVYGTMIADTDSSAYTAYESVLEENPDFYELRNAVLTGLDINTTNSIYAQDIAKNTYAQVYASGEINGAIAITNNPEANNLVDYLNNGPKNELYLQAGESVAFKLDTSRQAQIGLRSVTGAEVEYTINGTAQTLNSNVDMFYDLQAKDTPANSVVYTIINNGPGVLAITDIKVSDSVDGDIFAPLSEADLTMALIDLGYAEPENPFIDVPEDQYYYMPAIWGSIRDITNGVSEVDPLFAPDVDCSRSQVVTLLWRAMGCPEPETTDCPFSDVDMNEYYAKAVLWATENGITQGVGGDEFAPLREVTRAEFATLLYRTVGASAGSADCPFSDVDLDEYYADAVLWAVENSITTGVTATKFVPEGICSRAEVLTFLYRTFH